MLNLSFRYSPLFSLSLRHSFFSDSIYHGVKIKMTPEGQAILRKLGLTLKLEDGGISAFIDSERTEQLFYFLNNYDEKIMFNFKVYSANNYFINYTELPTESTNKILFFSNHSNKGNTQEETLLHKEPFAGSEYMYPLFNPVFEYQAESANSQVSIVSENGEWVYTDSGKERHFIDLQHSLPGKYTLMEDGKEKKTFVHTGDDEALKPIALVSLSLSELKESIIKSIEQENTIPTFRYKIFFRERQTFWKYFVVPKYSNSLKSSSIDTGSEEVTFSNPEEVTMANGEKAYVFTSETRIPIQEVSSYKFQLKNNSGLAAKTILNRLPAASFEVIKPESRNIDSKIFSEIIVYI
ncbi:MAG: hypothetical protein ACK4ND_11090 [Cytophagaceae bacterium]